MKTGAYNRKRIQKEILSLEAMGMRNAQVVEKLNEQGLKTWSGLDWTLPRLATFKFQTSKSKQTRAKKTKPSAPRKPSSEASDIVRLLGFVNKLGWSEEKKVRLISVCVAP